MIGKVTLTFGGFLYPCEGYKNILKIFSYLAGQNVKIFYFLHASAKILIFLCPHVAGERCFLFEGQISSEQCLECLLFFVL